MTALWVRYLLLEHEGERTRNSFALSAERTKSTIPFLFREYDGLLSGSQGLYLASKYVDAEEFHDFISNRFTDERYAGLQAFGELVHSDGELRINYLHARGRETPVRSLLAERLPTLQPALARAWEQSQSTLIEIHKNPRDHAETLLLAGPAEGKSPSADRRWVFALLDMQKIVESPAARFGLGAEELQIDVLAVQAQGKLMRVFKSQASPPEGPMLRTSFQARLGDQIFQINISSPAQTPTTLANRLTIAILGCGILIAALLIWLELTRAGAYDAAKTSMDNLRRAKREAQKLALVAGRTSNAVIISDALHVVEWVNDGFTRMLGYTLDEVRGRNPAEFLNGKHTCPQTIDLIHREVSAGRGVQTEILNYSKTGEEIWNRLEIQPIFDDKGVLINFISISSNITDQKIAEKELRTSEERYRGLVESQSEYIFRMAPDRRLTWANEIFARPLGKSGLFITGLPLEPFLHEGDLQELERVIEAVKRPPFRSTHRLRLFTEECLRGR